MMRRSRPLPAAAAKPDLTGVAKVVFESAKKSGVVLGGSGSVVDYSKQLQRFRHHSKKKGGSLGEVKLNLSQFVASQHPSQKPAAPRASPNPAGRAALRKRTTSVPLLDLGLPPIGARKPTKLSTHRVHPPGDPTPISEPDNLSLNVPSSAPHSEKRLGAGPAPSETPAAAASAPDLQTTLTFDDDATALKPTMKKVEEAAPEAANVLQFSTTKKESEAPRKVEKSAAESDKQTASAWEAVREREVQDLLSRQKEAEDRAKAEEKLRQLEAAEAEWIATRPQLATAISTSAVPHLAKLNELYHAVTWEDAAAAFSSIESQVSKAESANVMPHSNENHHITLMLERLGAGTTSADTPSREVKKALVEKLMRLGKDRKVSSRVLLEAKLRYQLENNTKDAAVTFMDSSPADKRLMSTSLLRRAISNSVAKGSWETGLNLYTTLKGSTRDTFCNIETAILQGLAMKPHSTESESSMVSVIDQISRKLHDQMPELGKAHTLVRAKANARWKGSNESREVASRFSTGTAVDEAFFGFLLSVTPAQQHDQIIAEIQSHNISLLDPQILHGRMVAFNKEKAYTAGLSAIVEARAKSGFRFSQKLATTTIFTCVEEGSRRAATIAADAFQRGVQRSFSEKFDVLLPLLYSHNMADEAVNIFDSFPIDPKQLSPNSVGCLNALLKAKDREPTSAQLPSGEVDRAMQGKAATSAAFGRSKSEDAKDEGANQMQHPAVEKMLEFAKLRKWESALELLGSSHGATTLLYNCALSASMERPDVVENLLNTMREREIEANATTYNTVMSVYSPTSRWEQAIDLFSSMDPKMKDIGTYSVALTLLGRRNMWESAVDVLGKMKKESNVAPTAAVYSLGIQAVHKHSWEATLAVFQKMHKTVGSSSIKELVVSRVTRALDAAGKADQIKKMEDMMKAKKKEKKAK